MFYLWTKRWPSGGVRERWQHNTVLPPRGCNRFMVQYNGAIVTSQWRDRADVERASLSSMRPKNRIWAWVGDWIFGSGMGWVWGRIWRHLPFAGAWPDSYGDIGGRSWRNSSGPRINVTVQHREAGLHRRGPFPGHPLPEILSKKANSMQCLCIKEVCCAVSFRPKAMHWLYGEWHPANPASHWW